MLNFFVILAGLLTGPVDLLVLESGATLNIREVVSAADGRVTFIGLDGVLYSLPLSAVDVEETDRRAAWRRARDPEPKDAEPVGEPLPWASRLPDTPQKERLLALMKKGIHRDAEGTGEQPASELYEEAPSGVEIDVEAGPDEAEWRSAAEAHRSRIEMMEIDLKLLQQRERQLNDHLLFVAGNSGHAGPWGYLVIELEDIRGAIPRVRAALDLARKEFAELQARARRAGAPPGWLR